MKFHARKAKGFNEIYFVLYLTALILLIPSKEEVELEESLSVENRSSLFIKSQKASLNVKLSSDTSGTKILSFDSVNVIYPVGGVKDAEYKFSVISNNRKKIIWSKDIKDQNNNFRVEKNPDNSIKFIWLPSNFSLTNQNLTILAEAELQSEDSVNSFPVYSKTQFNLNMFYVDQAPVFVSNLGDNSDEPTDSAPVESQVIIRNINSDLRLEPKESRVRSLAFENWQNEIIVWGADINNDIDRPKITVNSNDPNAKARVWNFNERKLIIGGKTPLNEIVRVTVELTRKFDQQIAICEFIVEPLNIKDPKIDDKMYPEISYSIKPMLPNVDGQKEEAMILKGDVVIASLKKGKNSFEFKPQFNDIGKDFFFVRKVNGNEVGDKIRIEVIDYPIPSIININTRGNDLIVTTRSYGYYQGKRNLVKTLIFNNDSMKFFDLSGETVEEEGSTIQVFRCNMGLDNPLPLRVELELEDNVGRKSDLKVINN